MFFPENIRAMPCDDDKHERNVNDLSRYKVNWLYKLYKLRDAAEAKIRNAIHLV